MKKKAPTPKIKLKEVTWVLGDKPKKALITSTGSWVDVTRK